MFVRRDLALFWLWWCVGMGLVVTVCVQSLSSSPIESPGFEYGDKLGHFLVYFCLMSWFVQLYQRASHVLLFVLFVALGILLEVLQGQTAYRMFEYADMLANSAGACLAWVLAKTCYSQLIEALEQRFLGS